MGMSRMTVHRALRELSGQGVLDRLAGVGTFVAEARPRSTLLEIADIKAETAARGHAYRCDVVRLAREPAGPEAAWALQLRAGDPVFHAVCVHREDGVPVQLEDRYVNPRAAPGFMDQAFLESGFSEYLVRTVPLDEMEHVVDAVLPAPWEAGLLEMGTREPCLVLTRRTWSGRTVVTWVRCVHPGARYRLGSRLRPGLTPGAAGSPPPAR
jgi:GntR family histidine utilization transcriptional repressor